MMQVKTSGFALASPSTQRAYDDLAALGVVDQFADQFAALPVVPVSGTNEDQVMPDDGVRLNLSDVVMSRVELVALLNRAALCDPETVAGLSPAEVRKLAVDVLLWEGQHALEEAVDRMSTQPSCGEWDDAYLELCEYQVELAFGLPCREFGFLDRSVSPAEAWARFTAGYAGTRPTPVDVLVHRTAAGVAPVSPSPAGVPADGEFGPARELVVA